MKSLMWLLECVLAEAGTRCDTDTQRDAITASRRIEHEGLSFLTISLPSFGSDFERGLDQGYVDSDLFLGFKRRLALPAFLQGLLSRVFDPLSGVLLDDPCLEAIICIRQFCLMWKKISLSCSPPREKRAFAGFIKCEHEMTGLLDRIPMEDLVLFRRVSSMIWPRVLMRTEESVYMKDLMPRHGPGATAERISGNQKYDIKRWHTRLDESFPFEVYGLPTPEAHLGGNHFEQVHFVEPGAEDPVRVISVPKTLKTPRIIAIEPVCMQYAQQAVMESIVDQIESSHLTRSLINFKDQSINRYLALDASKSGSLATLDLSEASDRVHKDVVRIMLETLPNLLEAVFACRSTRAHVSGCTIQLEKFASMGSALCFPLEAMVFFTICTMAVWRGLSTTLSMKSLSKAMNAVHVYGDDLIVPVDQVEAISDLLETFGLKVNRRKSFWTGKFRESCGMDAYDGIEVTPTYLRHLPPTGRHCASELVSFVSFANQLYTRGWWTTARRVREYVEGLIGPLPHVQDTSPCLGWASVDNRFSIQKYCTDLHRPLIKGFVVQSAWQGDVIDDYPALMKYFLKGGDFPCDEKHLERSVRPGSVRITRRWAPPY